MRYDLAFVRIRSEFVQNDRPEEPAAPGTSIVRVQACAASIRSAAAVSRDVPHVGHRGGAGAAPAHPVLAARGRDLRGASSGEGRALEMHGERVFKNQENV